MIINLATSQDWKKKHKAQVMCKDPIHKLLSYTLNYQFIQVNHENKYRSPNPTIPLVWKIKSSQLNTTLLCWTMKIMVPFYHFDWHIKILTNLPNHITHWTICSFKICRKKNQTIKSSNVNSMIWISHMLWKGKMKRSIFHCKFCSPSLM
jgi:hypothetical protein